MRIAICSLGYGHAEYTAAWLDSIARHSKGHDVALCLVDNASPDDGETSRVMKAANPHFFQRWEWPTGWWSLFPPINRLLREALELAPDAICLMDNDVLVGPRWLDGVALEVAHDQRLSRLPTSAKRKLGAHRYFVANGTLRDHDGPVRPPVGMNVAEMAETFYQLVEQQLPLTPPGTEPVSEQNWCWIWRPETVRAFYPFPETIRLWYGDSWMHHRLRTRGYRCHLVLSCYALHFQSVSSYARPDYQAIFEADGREFQRLLSEDRSRP